jgi:uncharacterized repeat protein (TIGR01451 family)
MKTNATRLVRVVLTALALWATSAGSALAQTVPTPEGTVITNIATASFTDANDNTYANVQAQASVTVGFLGGVSLSGPATGTPASPSTANELTYTITNTGNGVDTARVSVGTVPTGMTITGYKIGNTVYADLAALNTALASTALTQGGQVSFIVVYDIANSRGGQNHSITFTATSLRDGSKSDNQTTVLTPPISRSVTVTPDGTARDRLPSNGTQYTETFTILNGGNVSETFNLVGSTSVAGILTIVSVNGTTGLNGSITIAAGGTLTADVIYTVNDVAAGSSAQLRLTATSSADSGTNDQGHFVVTVIRPAISISKVAFRDDATTQIAAGSTVVPGEYIRYRITVANTGTAPASGIQVSDPLDAQLQYISTTGDAAGWTFTVLLNDVSAELSGTLAAGSSRHFWIRVRIR